ncbi:DUF4870 domain-containing protein [Persicobacter sp. CCB-QB2]|uniref:DUF4870 domain-containing protein n=1 Tax=Persicobacter sp. CCB-QB2 TaxID=1561025 RepID=UPI0006A9B06A|nr:DUF4870 domain-containing protein [Persicobacter sp. CCB-QB2]
MSNTLPVRYANSQEKQWGLFAHLGTLIGLCIPLANILVPLIIYLSKREESNFVAEHAKASFNFQVSMTIFLIISGLLSFLIIGIPFVILFALMTVICCIIAAIDLDKGKFYRYPLTIRFLD